MVGPVNIDTSVDVATPDYFGLREIAGKLINA